MPDAKASIRFIENCYQLYEQKMYQMAYSILRDSGLAEDAVQEAFLKLMKSNCYFEDVKSDDCKRYIITIVKHSSINIYNKKRREQEITFLTDNDDDLRDISETSVCSEKRDVMDMIEQLPSKYYAVVECLVVRDMSVKETAKRLCITEANVRKRFERAKLLLKTIVKGRNKDEDYGRIFES